MKTHTGSEACTQTRELPQQHVCQEEEVLSEQQLYDEERNSSLDQEEPEPPQMKEEQEEPISSQEGEQLVLKQEAETFMLTPTHEESEHSEPEPNSDQQLLSHYSPVAESQDQRGSEHVEPVSTRNEETKTKRNKQCYNICNNCGKRFNQKTHLIEHLKIHTDEMPFTCESCGRAFRQSVDLKIHMRTHWGVKPVKHLWEKIYATDLTK
ncbi:zinc finger protein 3 homolog isoform X1 [Scophthalmus maximus]|uniref:zinc finger protein 3 homolog isoform X1 n=1 Tax=Scophthalmus maximus TaxID=52904 RepID=UPI001FA8A78A|nr:zinc finger protein 3 homolog isoform X1 [Scophthalmus maximus]